jgi:hypothetical protein
MSEIGQPLVENNLDRRVARLMPKEDREQFYEDVEALFQARLTRLGKTEKDNGNKT